MNRVFLVRVAVGVTLAAVGFTITDFILPKVEILGSTQVLPLILALILGAIGIYLVPFITRVSQRFFNTFVRLLARELLAQIPFPRLGRSFGGNETKTYQNALILDTSAIIDGRVSEVAKTGFLDGTLVIPRFVLGELQHIADSADPLRRGRGRRGFAVIDELKEVGDGVKVEVSSLDFTKLKKTDDKLIQLAKRLKGRIVTTDYNLNRVAKISGIKVLNVNELANSIKTVLIPGEAMSVKVIQEGKESGQGVGFLPDGTMIVVEGGNSLIGQTVETEVERVFQTVAGRMIFVKPKRVNEGA